MNERIKQLVEKSYIYDRQNDSSFFNKELFAQLIVQECISVINTEAAVDHIEGEYERMWKMGTDFAVDQIEKHFGVEE